MKLSKWAKKHDMHYRTAWRLFTEGKVPNAYKLPSGQICVEDEIKKKPKKIIIYARVSSGDQKDDLKRQIERLKAFCLSADLEVENIIQEIGSGLNGNRKKLISILKDKSITHIVVEHRDRLVRFGFEMIKASLSADDRDIVVVDEDEFKDDIVQDFIDLATSMCARIYDRRSAKNRAQEIANVIKKKE